MKLFSTAEVANIVNLPNSRIRSFVRAGFLAPAKNKTGTLQFTFRDLLFLKTAKSLLASRVPPKRMVTILSSLKRQLPDEQHLSSLRIYADGRRVVVWDGKAQWQDFASYPRTLTTDLAALSELKIDLIWAPSVREMYPDGFATRIEPEGPAKAGLEDAFRPHFFGGVSTVVAKLLHQVTPHFAIFGEKDFQQLKVVTTMARDLDIPVTIVGVPTVREKDGLAMSSRNAYLSTSERAVAPTLHQVLKECASRIKDGQPIGAALADGRARIERAGFTVDYLEARSARTLAPIAALKDGPVRLLVAVKLGRTRLIDNIKV